MIKEDFCGACLTIPLAFAGAAGAGVAEEQNSLRKWAIWLTVASVVLTIYFVYVKKCKSCKFSS